MMYGCRVHNELAFVDFVACGQRQSVNMERMCVFEVA